MSTVKGVLAPISAFSRAADRNIVDHVNLDMNEDQGMTTFIMRVRILQRKGKPFDFQRGESNAWTWFLSCTVD